MIFKHDDKVRIRHNPYYAASELSEGQIGTVVKYMDDLYIEVRMDNGYTRDGDDLWPFAECELELVN